MKAMQLVAVACGLSVLACSWCYDGEYEGKDEVTEVVYRLVQESDEVGEKRYVVDDIRFVDRTPLRAELDALAQ